MLQQRGVAPVSDSVRQAASQKFGKSSGVGLWHIVTAFRADAEFRGQKKKNKKGQDQPHCFKVTEELLREHGYPDAHIQEAMTACGPDAARCVDYCLARNSGSVDVDDRQQKPLSQEDWCASIIRSLGFDSQLVAKTLEQVDWSFPLALSTLLNGNDHARTSYRFRRHTMQRKVLQMNLEKVSGSAVRSEYVQRAREHFHRDFHVVDLGQHAASTTGACFWLCLAAGLSKSGWRIEAHALPGLADSVELLADVQAMPLVDLDGKPGRDIAQTPLGRFAFKLRQYMCAGPGSVLLRPDMKDKVYAAFAGIDPNDAARTLSMYKNWAQKLATKEYADELVLLACALELRVRIVCVPYTPPGHLSANERKWAISS